jgi:hypothetical protein
MPYIHRSRFKAALVLAAMMSFCAMATPASAEDESQPCHQDGQVFAYGDVLANCIIEALADLDVFTFQGSAGDDAAIVITRTGGSAFSVGCIQLLAPDLSQVASACGTGRTDAVLPASGTYQVVVTAQSNSGTLTFNLSVERLSPLRSPTPIGFGDLVTGHEITPLADLDTFSFNAVAGDALRYILTRTGGSAFSAGCTEIRGPGNTSFVALTCGNVDLVLPAIPATGTYQVIVTAQNHSGTLTYNLSLTCLGGVCPNPPPNCLVDPTFAGGTLTLNFTIGAPQAAEWHVALLAVGSVITLWKAPLPVIDPPVAFALPIPGFPALGRIGLLSTLTDASDAGLICTDLATVDTGPMPLGVTPTAVRQFLQGR